MEWVYSSGNVSGNFHDLSRYLNSSAENRRWELVAASYAGHNTVFILKRQKAEGDGSLTNKDKRALVWALEKAREWHGNYTGDADAEHAFLQDMKKADAALAKLVPQCGATIPGGGFAEVTFCSRPEGHEGAHL